MKVTKNIKEYIEKEVSARLASKYEADKQTAEYENLIESEVWEEYLTAIQKAYDEVMAKAFAEYGFLENLRDGVFLYIFFLRMHHSIVDIRVERITDIAVDLHAQRGKNAHKLCHRHLYALFIGAIFCRLIERTL